MIRADHGFVSTWTVLAATGVTTLLLGLVVDGGTAMNDRLAAHRAAEQAARAGADQLAGIRSGDLHVDPEAAERAAHAVLATAGWGGQVSVAGTQVTVVVEGRTETTFLGAVGFASLPIRESGTATSITGEG
ncbi:pilus assembly protein TadG-related protein [Nocardioides bruguierae]|uniref:Pilus assembly protein TadG-related protein n=1 Tax=Nocardioides bruguierae TaxID=2945102 RepID=A0A9X2D9V5_9ACTN|nr:pilus assembly protein TadG-related protein [Nocardioides bruguierae]MCM0621948.1 pilus assembly protein TadG-related protein [Nocardioides bruguierae]